MIKLNYKYIAVFLLFIFSIAHTTGQNQSSRLSFHLPHIDQKIVVDGNIDEIVWDQALEIELGIETSPGENIKAPVKTIAYLFEDGQNLNVAFRAYDPDPSSITAHYHDHDQIFSDGDDTIGIKLDTQNDDLFAYQFFVNALGVKHDSIEDGTLSTDDESWNAIWDAAGKITENGYQVEISIPLRILRFDDSKSQQQWGFDLLRFYPRDTFHRISHHKVNRNISCTLCQNATLIGLKEVQTGKNLEIVPFMTATQHQYRNDPLTDNWQDSGIDTDFGADMRWGISANTTLNATINPDYSQVESDVAQLDNNNTFSLYYPEKRPFFIEGADYYKSMMDLVYTRNISDPDYGVKITHSSDNNNYAAFFTNDSQTNYILPGSTSSDIASYDATSTNAVIRYRHDLENSSSLGAMMTMRQADNYHNYVYGVDGIYRLSDTETVRAQFLGSDSEDPQQIVDEYSLQHTGSDGSAIDLHYKLNDRDWTLWGRYTRLAEGFRADLGYQPRDDYNRLTTGFERRWYEQKDSWWNTISAGIDTRHIYDLAGQLLHRKIEGSLHFQGLKRSGGGLHYQTGKRFWNGNLYDVSIINLHAGYTAMPGLKLGTSLTSSKTIDFSNSQPADQIEISPYLTLNFGQHFQTEIRFTRQIMDVSGGELFNTDLLDARLIYQFSTKSFLRFIVQYNDTERNQILYSDSVIASEQDLGTQLLYSYKINPQTVFFLGYSDAAFEDETLSQLEKTDKTLFMKMSYSWLY